MTIGVLAMAYGTANGPDDIERYYTDIRGGRAPTPEHLAELQARYAAIGNRFPLLEITRRQGAALERELNAEHTGLAYVPDEFRGRVQAALEAVGGPQGVRYDTRVIEPACLHAAGSRCASTPAQ